MNIKFNDTVNFSLNNNSSRNVKQHSSNSQPNYFDDLINDHLDYENKENFELKCDFSFSKNVDSKDFSTENHVNESGNYNIENDFNEKSCDDTIDEAKSNDINEECDSENTEDDKNFENLKSLVYILDCAYFSSNKDKNIFDLNTINNSDFENFCNSNKINEESLSKMLSLIGLSDINVENKTITTGEVLNTILNNSENFKMILKNEIIKFEEKEFDNSILKILDTGNLLDDMQLLRNLKNEISHKLNESIFVSNSKDNQSNLSVMNFTDIKNGLHSTITENKHRYYKDMDILKEIYGNTDLDMSIENYYVNTVRNGEMTSNYFEKIIDATNTNKFEKEFIDSIKYMSNNQKSEMSIKITPDHLGKIDIKYEVIKNNVRIIIRAERNEAIKLIDNTVNQIKNMVKEHHQIDLKNVYIDVGQFEFSSNGQNSRNNKDDRNDIKKDNIRIQEDKVTDNENELRGGVLV